MIVLYSCETMKKKMLSFEYISDHEFEAGDKKFILAN